MATVFVKLTFLLIVFELTTANDCNLSNGKLKKMVKKYKKKCLNRGFTSNLGCASSSALKLKKKGKKKCSAIERKLESCNYKICKGLKKDGGWGDYGDWSTCSLECGGGTQTRTKNCDSPLPANGGAECEGENEEIQSCNEQACAVDGGYSDWSSWGACSADCGGGTETRTRTCTNPAPAHGGAACSGDTSEDQICNSHPCPIYTMKAICDDQMTLWVDGVQTGRTDNWQKLLTLEIPATTGVLGIKCVNGGGSYGIMATIQDEAGDDVLVTDNSWSCSNAADDGWEKADFVEGENWNAASYYNHPPYVSGVGQWISMSANRKTIWTNSAADYTVYCRKSF